MIRKLLCFFGWHAERDLWLNSSTNMFNHLQRLTERGWGDWYKVPYDDFGLCYYLTCKHCKRRL